MFRTTLITFSLITFTVTSIFSQDTEVIAAEIQEQVWKVFKASYEQRDIEAFNSIHSDSMLRINDGGILTAAQYRRNIQNWVPPQDGASVTIDFALEKGHYTWEHVYQVGYYRVIFQDPQGRKQNYYGQFHVVLKKFDQTWKITQDFDTSTINGVTVDESFFDKAELMKLIIN